MTHLDKLYHPDLYSHPALIQSYSPYFSGGLGDFLGGALYLKRLCEEKQIPFSLDFKHHPLGKHLRNENESSYDYHPMEIISISELCETDYPQMEQTVTGLVKTCNEPAFVASFYFNGIHEQLKNPQRLRAEKERIKLLKPEQVFFQHSLRVSEEVENRYHDFLSENQLKEKEYALAHFRLGDRELLKEQNLSPESLRFLDEFEIDYENCIGRAQALKKALGRSLVVLSDSNELKKKLNEAADTELVPSPTQSGHSVLRPGLLRLDRAVTNTSIDHCFDLALDIRIIQGSQSVTSFSNHFWGSGLPFWLSRIFDLPISSIQIGKLIRRAEIVRPTKAP